ncbi:MAG: peroxiredoxin Q/BCP [Saprospiraceae bacterium]|jgi:peroxiredoxin Q/BCP
MIEKNVLAPSFNLPDQNEKAVSLANYKGQKVIVYFYPKDNTPGCTKQAIGFTDIYSQLQDRNVAVLGVSPDGAESHQKFISDFSIPYSLLSDPEKTMMTEYQSWGEKNMYGKKVTGVIRSTVLIDENGVVIKHWKRVANSADHHMKVLASLDA